MYIYMYLLQAISNGTRITNDLYEKNESRTAIILRYMYLYTILTYVQFMYSSIP
jgi:hypothetical protein